MGFGTVYSLLPVFTNIFCPDVEKLFCQATATMRFSKNHKDAINALSCTLHSTGTKNLHFPGSNKLWSTAAVSHTVCYQCKGVIRFYSTTKIDSALCHIEFVDIARNLN
jgi:hypothetical protein